MKERPILFSAPMVRALLAGTKTQTRRAWRQQPPAGVRVGYVPGETRTPYGQPGDRLWVRETWQGPILSADEWDRHGNDDPASLPGRFHSPNYCEYAADGGGPPEFMTADDELVCRWRPSIHMPRWASRITLKITDVRVEPLQAISEDDAKAEGIVYSSTLEGWHVENGTHFHGTDPRQSYLSLWEAINGEGSVMKNPWVWVVSFKRV